MATVTQLADRVCQVTSLQSTGTERALVIAALNNAYQRAIQESGAYRYTATKNLTSGTSDYDMISDFSLTDVLELRAVTFTGGGLTGTRGVRVPEELILQWRENNTNSSPILYYAMSGANLLRIYPSPGTSYTVTFSYIKTPPTLVESGPAAGEESTPSRVPVRFHWDVLMAGAAVEALDKDQRSEDVQFWLQRYNQGLAGLVEYVNRFGGDSTIQVGSNAAVWGAQRDSYPRGAGY